MWFNFKSNLICIFLSVRVKLKKTSDILCYSAVYVVFCFQPQQQKRWPKPLIWGPNWKTLVAVDPRIVVTLMVPIVMQILGFAYANLITQWQIQIIATKVGTGLKRIGLNFRKCNLNFLNPQIQDFQLQMYKITWDLNLKFCLIANLNTQKAF